MSQNELNKNKSNELLTDIYELINQDNQQIKRRINDRFKVEIKMDDDEEDDEEDSEIVAKREESTDDPKKKAKIETNYRDYWNYYNNNQILGQIQNQQAVANKQQPLIREPFKIETRSTFSRLNNNGGRKIKKSNRSTRLNNQKLYTCDICDRNFGTSTILIEHRRIHSNEKAFTCEICNKSFKQNSGFSRHKKIHFNNAEIDAIMRRSK